MVKLLIRLSVMTVAAATFVHYNNNTAALSANASQIRGAPAAPTVLVSPSKPAGFVPHANFVDLWKSAGRGHLQQDDIRAEQASKAFLAQRR